MVGVVVTPVAFALFCCSHFLDSLGMGREGRLIKIEIESF